jgi:hypothetical protein
MPRKMKEFTADDVSLIDKEIIIRHLKYHKVYSIEKIEKISMYRMDRIGYTSMYPTKFVKVAIEIIKNELKTKAN